MADEKDEPVGFLQLGKDIKTHTLSGPMSYTYLKPSEEAYQIYQNQGLELPLVILFGDVHFSQKKKCPIPCTPDNCLEIADNTFLQGIDALAENTPIDFYTESQEYFHSKDKFGDQGVLFTSFLEKLSLYCHRRNKRTNAEYNAKCGARNIRWQYGDIRFMWHYKECVPTLFQQYMGYLLTDEVETLSLHQLKKWISTFSPNEGFMSYTSYISEFCPYLDPDKQKQWISLVKDYTLSYANVIFDTATLFKEPIVINQTLYDHLYTTIQTYLKMKSDKKMKTKDLSYYDFRSELSEEDYDRYGQILKYYIEMITPPFFKYENVVRRCVLDTFHFIVRIADWMLTIIMDDTSNFQSGLMKQINKNPVMAFQDPTYWKNMYIFGFIHHHDWFLMTLLYIIRLRITTEDTHPLEYVKEMVQWRGITIDRRICMKMAPFLIQLRKWNIISALSNLTAPMVDLYTVLRMWKTPMNGISPTIAFGFFGDAHVRNLVKLLEHHGYIVIAEQRKNPETDPLGRCLSFNKNIILGNDIEIHHLLRHQPSKLQASHHARLQMENQLRKSVKNGTVAQQPNRINIYTQRRKNARIMHKSFLKKRKDIYNLNTSIASNFKFPNDNNKKNNTSNNINQLLNKGSNSLKKQKGGTQCQKKRNHLTQKKNRKY